MPSFDLVVIGAGPGGYVAAIRAAQLGMRTALVERDGRLGGTCLNVGCIPSKALLESSEMYHSTKSKLSANGISIAGASMDIVAMMARKEAIVKDLTDGIAVLMKKNKVEVLRGEGSLAATGRVRVKAEGREDELEAARILLATGSSTVELPFLKFDGERIVTSTEALSFGEAPKRLAVIGGGAIGLELGSVWHRLGSEVTVIELLPRIAPFADSQMSIFLERYLKAQGLQIRTGHKVTGASIEGGQVTLAIQNPKGESESAAFDKVLVSVGRKPNSGSAGIREAGVLLDERGFVKVDPHFRTNLENVYAIGDLIPGPMLAHKASEEGVAAAEIMAGKAGHVNYEVIPNVVYTHPELAQVGITEDEAKEKGIPVKTGKSYFKGNGRAKSLGDEDGLVKVVAHAGTDRLLGVHIVGARASDMIAEAAMAMEFKACSEDVARTCHAHPTLSEILKEAALAVDKRPIHG